MELKELQPVYDFIRDNAEIVDTVFTRVMKAAKIAKRGEELHFARAQEHLCSDGIFGPTPGVMEEEHRPYAPQEIEALRTGEGMAPYVRIFTNIGALSPEDVSSFTQEYGPTYATIAQLYQFGLLDWAFFDDDGTAHDHYSIPNSLQAALFNVDPNRLAEDLAESREARLDWYQRLPEGVEDRDFGDASQGPLIAIDVVVAHLFHKSSGRRPTTGEDGK